MKREYFCEGMGKGSSKGKAYRRERSKQNESFHGWAQFNKRFPFLGKYLLQCEIASAIFVISYF